MGYSCIGYSRIHRRVCPCTGQHLQEAALTRSDSHLRRLPGSLRGRNLCDFQPDVGGHRPPGCVWNPCSYWRDTVSVLKRKVPHVTPDDPHCPGRHGWLHGVLAGQLWADDFWCNGWHVWPAQHGNLRYPAGCVPRDSCGLPGRVLTGDGL